MVDKIDMVYTNIKIAKIPRLVTKWYPLLIIIILYLDRLPSKLYLENFNGTLIIFFYVSPNSS